MEIIPVIDVRDCIAVHAVAGQRANYQPLVTPLAEGCDPVAVARGYRKLFAFKTLYVADLDGIEGRGESPALAATLAEQMPGVELWLDAGRSNIDLSQPATTVIGSESLGTDELREPLRRSTVLSLDFRNGQFVGPSLLLREPEFWPRRVIVMTLSRVGTGRGPDLERIADIASRARPGSRVYAAGGMRDAGDLRAARAAGAHGALIATALHAQKIKADDLDEIIGL